MADEAQGREARADVLPADQLYETLVETSSELICLLDPDGGVAFASKAAVDLLGYQPDEMAGRHFSDFLDFEEAFQAEGIFREAKRGDSQLQREISARHKEGHQVHLILNARPVFDRGGEFKGAVAVISDISALKRLHENLERLANEDDLTGLANRRRFVEQLGGHLAHAERYGWRGALLMIDVDGLKEVNDAHGHAAGDDLITQMAERLGRRLRRTDFLARLWGDEFAVLLPEAGVEDASLAASALGTEIAGEPFRIGPGSEVRATASIGATLITGPADVEDLMEQADAALYRAKAKGPGGIELAEEPPAEQG